MPRKRTNEQTIYAPRATTMQKEVMVEFLEQHPQMINNTLTRNFTAAERAHLWNELTSILNAQGLGATKDVSGWRDSWSEYKSYVRKKVSNINASLQETGTEYIEASPLTSLEERIASLIGLNRGVVGIYALEGPHDDGPQNSLQPETHLLNSSSGHGVAPNENDDVSGSSTGEDVAENDDCITILEAVSLQPVGESSHGTYPPERGQRFKRKHPTEDHLPDPLVAAQLRAAKAMERLADSVLELVALEREKLRVNAQLEEKRLKVMSDKNDAEARRYSVFQQALTTFVNFFTK